MADEGMVGFVKERVDLSQRVRVVHHEDQFCVKTRLACGTCDHVTGEDFAKMSDVEFPTWRDARGDDVLITSLCKALRHHVAPVHESITLDGYGANQSSQRNIVHFVSHRFVDQHDGQNHFAAGLSNGFNGL